MTGVVGQQVAVELAGQFAGVVVAHFVTHGDDLRHAGAQQFKCGAGVAGLVLDHLADFPLVHLAAARTRAGHLGKHQQHAQRINLASLARDRLRAGNNSAHDDVALEEGLVLRRGVRDFPRHTGEGSGERVVFRGVGQAEADDAMAWVGFDVKFKLLHGGLVVRTSTIVEPRQARASDVPETWLPERRETMQPLKRELTGCLAHYRNLVANATQRGILNA